MQVKTPAEVRAELNRKGLSVAEWATANKLNPMLVYELLSGKKKGRRGAAHRAAVMLGLKDGQIVEAADVESALSHRSAA